MANCIAFRFGVNNKPNRRDLSAKGSPTFVLPIFVLFVCDYAEILKRLGWVFFYFIGLFLSV
ncbi:MAG: hypothetical protein LBK82_08280 [Planctomycetaceae bacterium]|nr:hypothetical protein [Planctomycetaceae bacterium]